jgi:cytochrome c biogenesis protein CcmG/thiol:disulfide interchange protein DsbE
MTHQTKAYLSILAVILLVAVGCSGQAQPSAQSAEPSTDGLPAIEEFSDTTLGQYAGQVVLLNFWAVWCQFCRAELPELQAVYQQYRDQGVVVLALNVSESSEDTAAYVAKAGLTFPVYRDGGQTTMRAFGARLLPTTVFINRQGQVHYRQVGAVSRESLAQQVEDLLP